MLLLPLRSISQRREKAHSLYQDLSGPALPSTQLLIKPHSSKGQNIMFKRVGSGLRVPGFKSHSIAC